MDRLIWRKKAKKSNKRQTLEKIQHKLQVRKCGHFLVMEVLGFLKEG